MNAKRATRVPAVSQAVSRAVSRAVDPPGERILTALVEILGRVPSSREHLGAHADDRARLVASRAARRAAMAAGGLALPPGPLGWITVLPELVTVWRMQAQMVADIAGAYGHDATLTREHMVYCLFRHTAAQAVRDLTVRVGERLLTRQVSLVTLQRVAAAIGVKLTHRAIGTGLSRWLPVAGAIGVGAYAYVDTVNVARTAIELFGQTRLEGTEDGSRSAEETDGAAVSRFDGHRGARSDA
jgi:hypothetical protein